MPNGGDNYGDGLDPVQRFVLSDLPHAEPDSPISRMTPGEPNAGRFDWIRPVTDAPPREPSPFPPAEPTPPVPAPSPESPPRVPPVVGCHCTLICGKSVDPKEPSWIRQPVPIQYQGNNPNPKCETAVGELLTMRFDVEGGGPRVVAPYHIWSPDPEVKFGAMLSMGIGQISGDGTLGQVWDAYCGDREINGLPVPCDVRIDFLVCASKAGTYTVITEWGGVVCRKTIHVKACTCDAFCISIDENLNVERAASCTLQLVEPEPYAIPPVEATDVFAPVVVMFDGDTNEKFDWKATSKNGHVEFAINPCAPGTACGTLKCGDLDIFFIKPSAKAAAQLMAGANSVVDRIDVNSTLGKCASIQIAINSRAIKDQGGPNSYLVSALTDGAGRPELFGAALPCDANNVDSCINYFEGDANLKREQPHSKLENLWDNTCDVWVFDRERCLDPLFRYAMVELCAAGWTISLVDNDDSVFDNPNNWNELATLDVPHVSQTVGIYGSDRKNPG